jgi:rod shape-determining protein MreD
MVYQTKSSFNWLKILNIAVIVVSVAICTILMLIRLPGMDLLGISPNWLLIWVVSWSVKRNVWQGAIAGIAMGCLYDAMTMNSPSHILSLVVVGVLTSALEKQRYIGEDFISVALIVFFMTIVAETIFAIQYGWLHLRNPEEVWREYQEIAIVSAIITSLWSPAFYYPFDRWQTMISNK